MIHLTKAAEVLLIEDNAEDELLALRAITKSGVPCNVTVRRDGAQALDYLIRESPPHLVILDYHLPRFNGLQVLQRLRAHPPTAHVPVVIFSGNEDAEIFDLCSKSGANSCVPKPSDPQAFSEALAWITHYWLRINMP